MSASLAFYSLLSLAPLLTVALSFATWTLGYTSSRDIFRDKVEIIFGSGVAEVIDSVLANRLPPRESWAGVILGIAVLLIGVTGVTEELRTSLNLIWQTSKHNEESFFTTTLKRSRDLLLVVALCTLVLAISLISLLTSSATEFVHLLMPAPQWAMHFLQFGGTFLLLFGLFFLIHRFVPDAAVSRNQALVAAFSTAVLFASGKELVATYIGKSAIGSAFGPGRSVVIILLWAQFSAAVLFLGAEFGKAYASEEEQTRNTG